MISLSYSHNIQLLMMEDANVFYDYFEIDNMGCNRVYLFKGKEQVCILRFDKGAEFIRIMGEI
ncbi:hypothetical protein JLT2_67 [Paraglaciecola Antarctic JLT virus 2]|nr:hypothetical protein JLT2_67 [Paraglaciecola Antarctic JLT virus 2]